MHKKQNRVWEIYKIATLLLYIPFFLVQVFINHDSVVCGSSKIAALNYCKAIPQPDVVKIDCSNNSKDKQTTLRLNKRFQPPVIYFTRHISFEISFYPAAIKLFQHYVAPLQPSFHLLAKKLRGPPAVA
jgi:hypothetical protein